VTEEREEEERRGEGKEGEIGRGIGIHAVTQAGRRR